MNKLTNLIGVVSNTLMFLKSKKWAIKLFMDAAKERLDQIKKDPKSFWKKGEGKDGWL